jgi:hypothetical protein
MDASLVHRKAVRRWQPFRYTQAIARERVLMVRERRKRPWNGQPPARVDAVRKEPFEEDLAERLLAADSDYVASMQQMLSASQAFQQRLNEQQLRMWLDLEETILAHLTLVQHRLYLAGCEEGREQMRRETRDELLEMLGRLLD